uniref:TNF receptor-associated factor 2 n=1 Tax=Podarcis muralis TaxID=64176 RepID=UPI0010A09336|nr:TNF receptor-associated factor 2 [Podarcis muralis]
MAASGSCTPPGFPKAILRAEVQGKYLCSECEDLLRRPFQAQCGHRYCAYCLKKLVGSGPLPCAACLREGLYEEGVSVLDSATAFPDNAARREVESLPAACAHRDCPWKGTVKEYEFADHVRSCGRFRAPCRFRPAGCGEVLEKEALPLHEAQNFPEHLGLLLNFALRLGAKDPHFFGGPHSAPEPRFFGAPDLVQDPQLVQEPHLFGGPHSAKDPLWSRTPISSEAQIWSKSPGPQFSPRPPFSWAPNLSQDPHPIGGPRSAPDPHFLGPPAPQPWAALELKTATLEKIVCVLNREVERLAAESAQERRREEERTEALTHKIRSLERNLALKEAGLAEVESALRRAEEATYDGVLIWKVEEVGWKRQEAVAGRASAIFSSAFYTSRYGYKMCLRLYLNGDGSGRNTHLSLFFVLMKGPNDALLKWPFNQKVTLMLLDQDHREHVIDAFRPDMTSSSFLRPIGALNVASGCPLFCPLSKMAARDSYIRDDTLFIKAIVDLTGL